MALRVLVRCRSFADFASGVPGFLTLRWVTLTIWGLRGPYPARNESRLPTGKDRDHRPVHRRRLPCPPHPRHPAAHVAYRDWTGTACGSAAAGPSGRATACPVPRRSVRPLRRRWGNALRCAPGVRHRRRQEPQRQSKPGLVSADGRGEGDPGCRVSGRERGRGRHRHVPPDRDPGAGSVRPRAAPGGLHGQIHQRGCDADGYCSRAAARRPARPPSRGARSRWPARGGSYWRSWRACQRHLKTDPLAAPEF